MIKQIILFVSLITSTVGYASDFNQCLMFVGKYSKQTDNKDTFSSQGLKIDVDLRASGLRLTFNSDLEPSLWRGWIESYIADGLPHSGDANTGKTYLVTCEQGKIFIKREGLLLKPMMNEISLSGDQLYYLSYAEGGEQHATFMNLKKAQ